MLGQIAFLTTYSTLIFGCLEYLDCNQQVRKEAVSSQDVERLLHCISTLIVGPSVP
jgi:hypothetical protein